MNAQEVHANAVADAEREVVEACLAEVVYIDQVRGKDISKMRDDSRFKAANKFVGLANDRLAAVRKLRTLREGAGK